jgi:orotate phosphoribosyltransferase
MVAESAEVINTLKELIKTRAFKKTDEPSFPLSSGKKSCFYFNMKKVTYFPEGEFLIGQAVYSKIKGLNLQPKAIGGLTMGADPVAVATSFTSFLKNSPIEAFSIRKEPKEHGMRLQIEGNVQKGDSVIILDDVVTTGKSTIQAIEIAKKHGLNVLCAVILVDRCEENGRQNIESKGVKVHSIFTVHDF